MAMGLGFTYKLQAKQLVVDLALQQFCPKKMVIFKLQGLGAPYFKQKFGKILPIKQNANLNYLHLSTHPMIHISIQMYDTLQMSIAPHPSNFKPIAFICVFLVGRNIFVQKVEMICSCRVDLLTCLLLIGHPCPSYIAH